MNCLTSCPVCGRREKSIICSLCKTPKDWKRAPFNAAPQIQPLIAEEAVAGQPERDFAVAAPFDLAAEIERLNKLFYPMYGRKP